MSRYSFDMRGRAAGFVIALTLAVMGCGKDATREYVLEGQITAIDPARGEVTIKHEDIPRFMPGMTMAFKVADGRLLQGRLPGDLVRATLVVAGNNAHLRTLERTGFAALAPSESAPPAPALAEGAAVADEAFVDEAGRARRLSDWAGTARAVTFIYTRCPVPTFCPLVDRHFQDAQALIRQGDLAGRVRLLSVSFDPEHDTPDVLAAHARRLSADPAVWQFLTGEREAVRRFAAQFGISILPPSGASDEIVHNLRTAVIDREGRLVRVLSGSDWTARDLVDALRRAAGAA